MNNLKKDDKIICVEAQLSIRMRYLPVYRSTPVGHPIFWRQSVKRGILSIPQSAFLIRFPHPRLI